jgi:hypothetical protein
MVATPMAATSSPAARSSTGWLNASWESVRVWVDDGHVDS